jgi:carbamoyltransferase
MDAKIVLSLHLGHNSTAAIGRDGSVLGVLSQERCDYKKNSADFPSLAIYALLKQSGYSVDDIGVIIICSEEVYHPAQYDYLYKQDNVDRPNDGPLVFFKSLIKSLYKLAGPIKGLRKKFHLSKGMHYLDECLVNIGLGDVQRIFHNHHQCHAAAAYYSFVEFGGGKYSDSNSAVVTLDGYGDDVCATISRLRSDGSLETVSTSNAKYSIGAIYAETTKYLGMRVLEHEYKVMGLSAYPQKRYYLPVYEKIFKNYIQLTGKNRLQFTTIADPAKNFYDHLRKNAHGQRFDNIAAALQHLLEEIVTEWVASVVSTFNASKLHFGGGVFMNVKLNKRLLEEITLDQFLFMPSCGDESLAIGGLYQHFVSKGKSTKPLDSLYLGVSFDNNDVKEFLEKNSLSEEYDVIFKDDIETEIAELLAVGEIVGRVAGRCEFGARSLGNRAILGDPRSIDTFLKINNLVKSRDFWMPFAPSILSERAVEYLIGYHPQRECAAHMMTAYAATPLARKDLRAAIHQGDGTLRPQVVTHNSNPRYHRLISIFNERTGVGGILNTSLNIHGRPLNSTLEQAMDTFRSSGLKYIALESFLVSKRGKVECGTGI